MGDRLGEQDGYPAGVSNAHPHFHGGGETVDCPECGVGLEVEAGTAYCERCDIELDEDAVRDQIEARNEPPEAEGE